jgi:predicted O-methyltransferase YrrM
MSVIAIKSRLRAAIGRGSRRTPVVEHNAHVAPDNQWYAPTLAGASTFGPGICSANAVRSALRVLDTLTPDVYSTFVSDFYRAGLDRHGDAWTYGDVNTALLVLAAGLRPASYLEIGVRRGRSLAMLASQVPDCHIVGCDMFIEGYAGMDNPGPDFVRAELARGGFRGRLDFLVGDSHVVLPAFFAEQPDQYFDLVTVDGDHSAKGARADLQVAMPRVKIGGALIFDDISNPGHPELRRVWEDVVVSKSQFSTFTFAEIGFGVGIAIRHV